MNIPGKQLANTLLAAVCLVSVQATHAYTRTLPPIDVDIIGETETVRASREQTLLDIARHHGIGQNEILLANPEVDRWLPADGSRVLIPSRYILPDAPREGMILNLPEMRLYYFPKFADNETPVVITHPVSVGRMDWETPLGKTRIASKQVDPSWRPPQSLKEEALLDGEILPDVVPPGPDNPLGRYAMRLGIPGYLIHSTNKPYGVGMRVTHGCIRMYPEDIERLFDDVPVGTPVHIVNQPIKLGWHTGALFIELHPPMDEDAEQYADYMQNVLDAIAGFLANGQNLPGNGEDGQFALDGKALRRAVSETSGLPVQISR